MTADDVKFSSDKVMDPKVDAPHLCNYFEDITGCEAMDSHTVRFTCRKPYYRYLVMIGGLHTFPGTYTAKAI